VGEPRIGGDHNLALVPQLSGKKDVRSDLNASDVSCECRVLQAYGVPCLHNVAHAHAVGIEPHDLFHVKDRAETRKTQYPDILENPMLSDFDIYERCVTHPPPPDEYTTVMCVFTFWLVGCAFLKPPPYNTTHIHTQLSTPILNCSHIHTE